MTIYLPKHIGHKYCLGSIIYKKINGERVFMKVEQVFYYGFKSKNTHIKFKGKRINKSK